MGEDSSKVAAAVAEVLWRQAAEDPEARSPDAKMKEAMAPVIQGFTKDVESRRSQGATEAEIAGLVEQAESFLASQAEIPPDVADLVIGEMRKAAGLK